MDRKSLSVTGAVALLCSGGSERSLWRRVHGEHHHLRAPEAAPFHPYPCQHAPAMTAPATAQIRSYCCILFVCLM